MKWKRWTTWLLLVSAWIGLAAWQYTEYQRVRRLAFEELSREARAVNRALVGGIRTHRRMGSFFEENLQQAIDDVVASETVVAAAIKSEAGERLASAGDAALLDADEEACRKASTWAFHDRFELQPEMDRGHEPQGGGGRGRGMGWRRFQESDEESTSSEARIFHSVLLLDAKPTESRSRREAILRGLVVVAGSLVLLCVSLAWRSSLHAAAADGHAKLLETEARHLRDLSQAAAGLAHETRNPLGLIRGWTQRLAVGFPDQSEQRETALTVVEECDRVTARINQFLSFARPATPKIETVLVEEVVDELAALLEPILDAKQLTLEHDISSLNVSIQADREMLRQALFNLLQNAVQCSSDEKTIEVAIEHCSIGKCRLTISDRGCGVPDTAVESLFTPYFTTRADGTGLGLAIVRRIAMAHGWQAGYTSRPGGGSIFWLDQIDG